MSVFEKLAAHFQVNWTTILVGWRGLGVFSPWPDRRMEFPPLLSPSELAIYSQERLESSPDAAEERLVVDLCSLDLEREGRQAVEDLLKRLADLTKHDADFELRKWRLVILEELLANIPNDPVYGLIALTEFWQSFGFPANSPHEIQGRGNKVTPSEYYQAETLQRLLVRHQEWIQQEKSSLQSPPSN
jgi:hypothetical protein